jgi:glycosyltransferase involved in cell wall biosynthesis
LKILLVIDSLKRGGKEGQFCELLRGIKTYDQIKMAVVIRKNIIEYPEVLRLGHDIFIAPSPSPLRFISFLNKVITEFGPDIIHSWQVFVTLNSVLLGILKRIKVINFDIQYAHKLKVLSRLYICGKFNQILSYRNMANSYAGLKAFHLKPSRKNRVIYNGLDLNRIINAAPINIRDKLKLKNSSLICMIANFSLPKDYSTLIEAGKKILTERQDVNFIFIGEGRERVSMQNFVPKELTGHFIFLGKRNDVENIVNEIDIGVLLSKKGHAEGISNSIMEYMAAGKPVIATKVGGNSELVVDSTTGYLISCRNVWELTRKLNFLLDNHEKRAEMGRAGRERIKNMFGLDRMVSQFVDLYNELMDKS